VDINLTIVGEMITFAILIFVTMKYIWPPLKKAMDEREKKIADGLAAAERGEKSLELARDNVKKQLKDVKIQASNIIDEANRRMAKIIDDAKVTADIEGKRLLVNAKKEIDSELQKARDSIKAEVVDLAIMAAEKLLCKKISDKKDRVFVDKIIDEL